VSGFCNKVIKHPVSQKEGNVVTAEETLAVEETLCCTQRKQQQNRRIQRQFL